MGTGSNGVEKKEESDHPACIKGGERKLRESGSAKREGGLVGQLIKKKGGWLSRYMANPRGLEKGRGEEYLCLQKK